MFGFLRFIRLLRGPVQLLLACSAVVNAAEVRVAIDGDDRHPGTEEAPFRTLAAARDAVRGRAGKERVTVVVGPGVHYLPETLVFTAPDSGTTENPVIYRAARDGTVVLSGGLKLGLEWKPWRDGIFQATTPEGLAIDQLFIGGKRQQMARYPNHDANQPTAAYQGFAADAFSKERVATWADPAGGYIHAMHASRWGGYHYRITGKNPDGTVAYEGGWQNNRQMGMHKDFRMVENIFEELDAPGEWFHNAKNRVLYYKPDAGADLTAASVEVVRLRHLIEFQGSAESPVKHITLEGFTFRHAARTFMDTREPLNRSDWTIYRGGTVLLTGTEDVAILDGDFDQVGGNAIFVNHYNRRSLIKGCHIHDAGGSGVCFVGDPAAVRGPLFEYAQGQDLAKIDRVPGPKTENYPVDSAVEDCLIHGIGRVERQPAGVQISMARRIAVRDTSIYDCARAGINVSEGAWGGHLIERCDVFDTVLETHDHGSFNSWGRDRYWDHRHRDVSQPAVKADPALPFLDAMETTVIRDSRWRCDHGWDIDLDDGSSNYEIHHNLLLAGGLKFREGYRRKAWNNVIVNNGFHPHVWFEDSGDEFHGNIVMKAHADIGQPPHWAAGVDRNLFRTEPDRLAKLSAGGDRNSIAGDPLFVDAATGDFRVKDGSPAFKIGFKNFPMDQFGVKKPALRAMAKTPVIPALEQPVAAVGEALPAYWLGALLHGLEGEEFSAFGVSREDAGVQFVEVPANSAAALAGLKHGDLIQQLNGSPVRDVAGLSAAWLAAGQARIKLRAVRNQQVLTLELPPQTPFLATETGRDAADFKNLPLPAAPTGRVAASRATSNDPLAVLVDGQLAKSYGPVFANGIRNGAYKLELSDSRPVTGITAWSFNQGGARARQFVTLFGSDSAADPGWNTGDRSRFVPLGTIDTASLPRADHVAASLRAGAGQSLGTFRWIVWQISPVTTIGENTAFQELAVESKP